MNFKLRKCRRGHDRIVGRATLLVMMATNFQTFRPDLYCPLIIGQTGKEFDFQRPVQMEAACC